MASSPQRPDPNRRLEDTPELQPGMTNPRRSGGGWFAWWWIWLFIILCAVWFAGWGWGGYGGWWWGNRGVYPSAYRNGAVTPPGTVAGAAGGSGQLTASGPGMAILNATNKTASIGQSFAVNGAPIQKKLNDHALWVGQNSSTPMLVVLNGAADTAANANLAAGERVNVMGTVKKAPAPAAARKKWGLSQSGAQRLAQEGAYIEANQVEAANQAESAAP